MRIQGADLASTLGAAPAAVKNRRVMQMHQGGVDGLPARPYHRRIDSMLRHRAGLALVALRTALACAAVAGPLEDGAPARPPGRRVVLVGIDGADWLAIDPLIAAGRLPAFARLRAHGRTGALLATPPLVSPIVWTTIATGRRPEDHRILDFMVDLPSGGQAPVPSTERRTAALWNVFSDRGRTVGVLGWWATWPAETVGGTIVTDRVTPQLAGAPAPLDARAVHPPARVADVSARLVRATDLSPADLAAYVPGARPPAATAAPGTRFRDPVAHLAAVVASTRTTERLAQWLVAAGQPDLLMVYTEGVDSLSHRFVLDRANGRRVIERAYADADALLQQVASAVEPSTWIVVCSDHGFYPADAGIDVDPAELAGPATAWHRPWGIVAAIEAGALAGGKAAGAPSDAGTVTPLDIAPTLLHAASLPVSLEMPGRPIPALLPPEAAGREVAKVRSFETGRRDPATAPADAGSAIAIERLQALGYVTAGGSSLARLNLGEVLFRRGDPAAAERELRRVVDEQPKNVAALLWLAKALRAQGRPAAALPYYERALAAGGDDGGALVEAVDTALEAKDLGAARSYVARPAAKGRGAEAAIARSAVALADGDRARAERELLSAVAAGPTNAEALGRLLDLLVISRRAAEAVAPLTRAVETVPGSARIQALLGEALLASGQPARALPPLERALDLSPDAVAVRIDLARAALGAGRTSRARDVLEPAPASRERSTLLGVAAAREERWAEAAARYREALAAGEERPDLLNGLAWALERLGRSSEAAALLDRSLALEPEQPQIRRLRAQIAGSKGD
jgi:tetratricopeptide (TPR) repeat protein